MNQHEKKCFTLEVCTEIQKFVNITPLFLFNCISVFFFLHVIHEVP